MIKIRELSSLDGAGPTRAELAQCGLSARQCFAQSWRPTIYCSISFRTLVLEPFGSLTRRRRFRKSIIMALPRQRLGRAADRILGPERPEVFGAASALAPHFFGLVEFARFGRSSKQRDGVKKTGCRSDRDRQRRGRRGCEHRSKLVLHCRVSD